MPGARSCAADVSGWSALPYLEPLDAAALEGLGLPAWPFGIAFKVPFGEVDALGHVNNVAYFRWFETVRVAYLKARGLSGFDGTSPFRIVARSTECHYRREMLYDESFVVSARVSAFRRTSFTMDYAVHAPDLRATGSCVVVLLSDATHEKAPIPEDQRRMFVEIDGAQSS